MVTELPPPPAPLIERLEASFPSPAELSPYGHLWASEGEPSPESVPVRRVHGGETEDPLRLAFGESAMANPIELLLDRLGFSFRQFFLKIRDKNAIIEGSETGGDESPAPSPTGDPIPVDGGG